MPAKPPKQYQFKPGQSGNPKGRPLNPVSKILKEITKESLALILENILSGNIDNLIRVAKDTKSSAMEAGIAKCFVTAYNKGDYNTMERIIERIVGKIPEEILVKSKNLNANIQALDETKMKAIMKKLEEDV